MAHAWADARSVFLSDLHLGWKYSKPASLLHLLRSVRPEYIYLVGDTFEWYHRSNQSCKSMREVLDLLEEFVCRGTSVYLVPGNHDAELATMQTYFGIDVGCSLIHRSVAGESFLITHGDIFDQHHLSSMTLIENIGSMLYPSLLAIGDLLEQCGFADVNNHWCSSIKKRSRRAEAHIQSFELFMSRLAMQNGCDGVICGHIHRPALRRYGSIQYFNCGDWVEHCSFIIETQAGGFELHRFPLGRQSYPTTSSTIASDTMQARESVIC